MLDFGRVILMATIIATLVVSLAVSTPIEFEGADGGAQNFDIHKRYSEFLGGPGKRSMDGIDEPVKRYSEFLGGPGKRYSEFLGGPGKRSRQDNYRNAAKIREALRLILSGARSQDFDDRR